MNLAVTSNADDFNRALVSFIRESGKTVPEGLRFQGRLLIQRLISGRSVGGSRGNATPPDTRAQGRAAVARDINRPISLLSDILKYQEENDGVLKRIGLIPLLRKADRQGDNELVSYILRNLGWEKSEADFVDFDPQSMHEDVRRKGKVPGKKWEKKIVTNSGEVKDYIRQKQENVGMAKGGWAAALVALGGRAAPWYGKHSRQGTIDDRSNDFTQPEIDFQNNSPWADSAAEASVVRSALESRTQAMVDHIAMMAQKAANRTIR